MEEYEELIEAVKRTLDRLYKDDEFLFDHDLSERNMVFHFAMYFIELLKRTKYEKLSVDCEYNRYAANKIDAKDNEIKSIQSKTIGNTEILKGKKQRIFPDLILHERGNNDNNILAIEFKKYNNYLKENDYYKLKYLTNSEKEYKYHLGLFIRLGKQRENTKIVMFNKGREIENITDFYCN